MSQTAKRHRISDAERYQSGDGGARTVPRRGRPRSWGPARGGHVLVSLPRAVPRRPGPEQGAARVRAGRVFLRAHARARDRVRPARRRRGVDRERGREPRRRRHRHRRRGSDPDRPGRQGDAAPRARQQHGAVVVLVGVGDGHERDGHGARGARAGADQRARALVHGLPRVGLRRRGRARRRDPRRRRGPRRLDLARQASRPRRPGGSRRRWAARARSCVSAPATAAPSWPRHSPRHERGPDRRSPSWTQAARSSSPTRGQASSSASPRGCRRWTPRSAGNRAWTSGVSPVTPSSRRASTTTGSARRRS